MKKVIYYILVVFFIALGLTGCDYSFNDGKETTTLSTPIIKEVKNSVVYWTEVQNAKSYDIKINNFQKIVEVH